jgi:6-phosphogluconolactonase
MPTPAVLVAPVAALADAFARRCEEVAARTIAARGRFALAVPGGSVAGAFLPVLARAELPWERVALFWVDERAVPATDPRSNYGAARRLWLGASAASRVTWHPLFDGAASGDASAAHVALAHAAREQGRELERLLGAPPAPDVVLLGVGEDGHVASLFPGHPALAVTDTWVVAVYDAPKPPACRLTMTLPVLTGAPTVVIAAFGAGKREAVRGALSGADTPVGRVARAARVELLLDPDAAGDASGDARGDAPGDAPGDATRHRLASPPPFFPRSP